MRGLNWKLSGALLLIVAVSVGIMAFLTNLSTTREFQQYVSQGNMMRAQAIADSLGEYYSASGNWSNLQETLLSIPRPGGERIIVADRRGTIIGDTEGDWLGREASSVGLGDGTAITASGQTSGELYLLSSEGTGMGMGRGHMGGRNVTPTPLLSAAEDDFLAQVNRSLWQAGLIAAAVALIAGLVLTRQITRPIHALIAGARHISGGDLHYRVKVKSRDEIGELAESFNAMASSLEKGEQSRRQLTADVAHELRTPLTVIEGTVDGILDGVFQPDAERLNAIKEQAAQLTRLIGDLRDLSLAESGQLRLDLSLTDIAELLRRMAAHHEIKAREKNVRLDTETAPGLPEARVDPARLEQVVSNLLTNAIRHTPPGGTVTVKADRHDQGLLISVADTGEGIAPEDLPRIFERFYRSGGSRARKEGGTGLGLAIVRQMVEAHGGRVWAENRKEKGSVFHVLLPSG